MDKKKVFIDEDSADTIFNKLFDLKFLNNDVDFGDDDDISETDFFDTINKGTVEILGVSLNQEIYCSI